MPRQQVANKSKQVSPQAPTSFQYTGPVVPRSHIDTLAPAAPTFGQLAKEGFSFGVGTAVARQVVDRLFGASMATQPTAPQQKKDDPIMSPFLTDQQRLQYNQCILEGGTHSHCKELLQ